MSETVLYNFAGDASNPGILVQNGTTLYGNAQNGGTYSKGKIYSISINGSSYTTLYNFGTNANDGVTPTWLVINSTGTTLYGTTLTGGVNNNGTLFSLSTTSPYTYNKLYDFSNNGVSGSVPFRLKISGNVLYGTSITNYPALNYGTIYSYNISTLTFAQVYISPTPSIIFQTLDISGTTLYYTTNRFGGPPFNSIIYSIPTTGGSPATVYNIGSTNPSNLIVSGGKIYGSNQTDQLSIYSGWGIFSVSTSGTGFQQLVTGSYIGPYMTNLILSGTTLYASISNSSPDNGSIYSISTSGTNGNTLYSFAGPTTDGSNPLVAVSSGFTLYGTTFTGGSLNNGTVFSFYNGKIYNVFPSGPTISDAYNISTNGTCQIGDNSNNLLTGTLASPPGKTNTYILAVRGNINCVGTSTDVSGASTGTYYSNSVTSFRIAADSSANRPPQSATGYIRYNTDLSQNNIEYYNGFNSLWQQCATTTFLQNSFSKLPTITQLTTSSVSPYTPPSGALYLKIRMVGGGGGGAGSGDITSTPTLTAGGLGGTTSFGSGPLFTATGGSGGTLATVSGSFAPGGTGTINVAYKGTFLAGGQGGGAADYNNAYVQAGGAGGSSAFGGGGGTGGGSNAPVSGGNGTAGGGGGGGGTCQGTLANMVTGAGGGAGGYVEVYLPSPTGTYTFVVGAGGTAGAGNSFINTGAPRGGNGGTGGAGLIIIEEFYH